MGSSVRISQGDWNKVLPLDSSYLLTQLPQKTPTPNPTLKPQPPYPPKKTSTSLGFLIFKVLCWQPSPTQDVSESLG